MRDVTLSVSLISRVPLRPRELDWLFELVIEDDDINVRGSLMFERFEIVAKREDPRRLYLI